MDDTTALLLTLTWTGFSAVAMIAHLWSSSDAYRSFQALVTAQLDGSARLAALTHLRLSLMLALVQSLQLFVGVVGLSGMGKQSSLVGWLSLGALVGAEALLTFLAVFLVWSRRRLRSLVQDESELTA